jgi:hypothetical protein
LAKAACGVDFNASQMAAWPAIADEAPSFARRQRPVQSRISRVKNGVRAFLIAD